MTTNLGGHDLKLEQILNQIVEGTLDSKINLKLLMITITGGRRTTITNSHLQGK